MESIAFNQINKWKNLPSPECFVDINVVGIPNDVLVRMNSFGYFSTNKGKFIKLAEFIEECYWKHLHRHPDIEGFINAYIHLIEEQCRDNVDAQKTFEENMLASEEKKSLCEQHSTNKEMILEDLLRDIGVEETNYDYDNLCFALNNEEKWIYTGSTTSSYKPLDILELSVYVSYHNSKEERKKDYVRDKWLINFYNLLRNPSFTIPEYLEPFQPTSFIRRISTKQKPLTQQECNKAYQDILGREIDGSGWTSIQASKTLTLNQLYRSLLDSEEYRRQHTSPLKIVKIQELLTGKKFLKYPLKSDKLRIKFLSWLGISGYCMASRLIAKSLLTQDIEFLYKPINYYNFSVEKMSEMDKELISLYDIDDEYDYDVLVLHSVPKDWKQMIEEEKKKHKNKFLTYGITIWETDNIPDSWKEDLRLVDVVSIPSQFNYQVFRSNLKNIVLDTVFHPIEEITLDNNTQIEPYNLIDEAREKYKYIFYTINEWNGRKGIEEMLEAYCTEFDRRHDEGVLLYMKVSGGTVSKQAMESYVQKMRDKYPYACDIILDKSFLSVSKIYRIHQQSDCYVTFTKAEGMGYGICEAVMFEKPVIAGGYGAQKEYAPFVNYLEYTIGPALFCSKEVEPEVHSLCTPTCCHVNDFYDASKQNWGIPSIEDGKKQMRKMFLSNDNSGSLKSKSYLLRNFNHITVGEKFIESIKSFLYLKY